MSEDEEIVLPESDEFVERFSTGVTVGSAPENYFILDFLKDDISLIGERKGDGAQISGFKGTKVPNTRIFLTKKTTKDLFNAIKDQLKVEGELDEIVDEWEGID